MRTGRAPTPHLRTAKSRSQSSQSRDQRCSSQCLPHPHRRPFQPPHHPPVRLPSRSTSRSDTSLIQSRREGPGVRNDYPSSRRFTIHPSDAGPDDGRGSEGVRYRCKEIQGSDAGISTRSGEEILAGFQHDYRDPLCEGQSATWSGEGGEHGDV